MLIIVNHSIHLTTDIEFYQYMILISVLTEYSGIILVIKKIEYKNYTKS